MRVYAVSLLVFAVAWLVAWLAFVRPLLHRYAATTGLMARLDAAEGDAWARLTLWMEGRKALAVLFATSLGSMLKGAADQAAAVAGGLTPDAVAPLQDRGLWAAIVGDAAAFRILAALQLFCAFLVLKGHLAAARLEPRVAGLQIPGPRVAEPEASGPAAEA